MANANVSQRSNSRRDRTRAALLQAGKELFAEHSLDAVSIDEIVQKAAVSKGTFYNYFQDRDDFAFAVFVKLKSELTAEVLAINEGVTDPALRLARGMSAAVRFTFRDPQSVATMLHLTRRSWGEAVDEGVTADIRGGISSGRFSIPTQHAAVIFAIAVGNAACTVALETPRDLAVILTQQLFMELLRGLGVGDSDANAISAQAVSDILIAPGGESKSGTGFAPAMRSGF